jgi:hypothetical protein
MPNLININLHNIILKHLFIVVLTIANSNSIFGQIYQGSSTDKVGHQYAVSLQFLNDSSVIFICNTPGNEIYAEYAGSKSGINDSVIHLNLKMTFAKFDVMH